MSDTVKNWWEDEKRFGKLEDKFATMPGDGLFFKTREELEEWERAHPPKVPFLKRKDDSK